MPQYGVSDTEREIITKLDMILQIVTDLQQRQRSMDERQKAIKAEIEEAPAAPVQGGFASTDFGQQKMPLP